MKGNWHSMIRNLPMGLSTSQAARRLRKNYNTTRYWLVKRGYHRKDGRKTPWPRSRWQQASTVNPARVNWRWPDAAIARKFGVSRQRVWQIRRKRNNGEN